MILICAVSIVGM
jgi:Skp family chaperone for outer membrane proteins